MHTTALDIIPAMTDPMGIHWNQPNREDILMEHSFGDSIRNIPYSSVCLMSKETFDMLSDYSQSQPSGVYPGKMWKAYYTKRKEWLLHWFGEEIHDSCTRYWSEILIVE